MQNITITTNTEQQIRDLLRDNCGERFDEAMAGMVQILALNLFAAWLETDGPKSSHGSATVREESLNMQLCIRSGNWATHGVKFTIKDYIAMAYEHAVRLRALTPAAPWRSDGLAADPVTVFGRARKMFLEDLAELERGKKLVKRADWEDRENRARWYTCPDGAVFVAPLAKGCGK